MADLAELVAEAVRRALASSSLMQAMRNGGAYGNELAGKLPRADQRMKLQAELAAACSEMKEGTPALDYMNACLSAFLITRPPSPKQ